MNLDDEDDDPLSRFNPSKSLNALAASTPADELDLFWASPIVPTAEIETAGGVILWWYSKRTQYPTLWQFAVDYLTASGDYLVSADLMPAQRPA
jgi:hypothetical protein